MRTISISHILVTVLLSVRWGSGFFVLRNTVVVTAVSALLKTPYVSDQSEFTVRSIPLRDLVRVGFKLNSFLESAKKA